MRKSNDEMPYVPSPEEKQLVEGCLKGDASIQKRLFEKHYGKMLGICQRYAVDRDEAKDILQEAFIKIFQKMAQFSFNSPLEAWMRRIVVNTAIDKYRKNTAEPVHFDLEEARTVGHDDHDVVSDMTHSEMLMCIQDLPAGYRMVFNMYVIEGYSHKEIGDELGISEGTSKSQLAKARLYMQKLLARKFAGGHE